MVLVGVIRTPIRWLEVGWRSLASFWGLLLRALGLRSGPDPYTVMTFRAIADAVIPETPELEQELGAEHVPGGLSIDIEEFVVTYIDDGFQFGLPDLGPQGNIPLATPIANVLDAAAVKLLEEGNNEDEPSTDRALALLGPDDPEPDDLAGAVGTFAELSRQDRLRAISILDDFEIEVSPTDQDLFELDAGLVGQLVVGFMEMIYYSEWEGYDEFNQPPSQRSHPNTPDAVQSWRQTGFPGFKPGYAALRGYLGLDGSSLGDGDPWTTVDETAGVRIVRESGDFRENDYDTSDYVEPFPVENA